MNVSSEHCNISDWLRLEATVKASVYAVAFSFATFITVIIIAIVLQNSKLRKEVRYILLCHHLLCISSYCGLGVVFQGMRALLASSPMLICWVVFGVQLSVGEGILFTLALMAVNTYLAICWPLKSLSLVGSVKYRVLAGTWIIIILKNVCLFVIEGTNSTTVAVLKAEPLCPVILNGTPARATGSMSFDNCIEPYDTNNQDRTIPSPRKVPWGPLAVSPLFYPATNKHQPVFCPYGFSFSKMSCNWHHINEIVPLSALMA